MMNSPEVLHAFLDHLTEALIVYLSYQIESGAQVSLPSTFLTWPYKGQLYLHSHHCYASSPLLLVPAETCVEARHTDSGNSICAVPQFRDMGGSRSKTCLLPQEEMINTHQQALGHGASTDELEL